MAYVNTKKMLLDATEGGYAIGAFNAENLETVQAIVLAAEEMNSPVIIQTTPSSIKYAGFDSFVAMVKALSAKSRVDIALHVDHGESAEFCSQGIAAGYSSVMIDGSKLSLEGNIALTKEVMKEAERHNVTVEAELGTLAGKEDGLVSDTAIYTAPSEVERFVEETNIDSLAVAIGTAHGVYKTTPILRTDLIPQIKAVAKGTPLVLHGSSGLSDEVIIECVRLGIAKVNFATELRIAFSNAIKEYIALNPTVIDPKKYLEKARLAVKNVVVQRIGILGCGR